MRLYLGIIGCVILSVASFFVGRMLTDKNRKNATAQPITELHYPSLEPPRVDSLPVLVVSGTGDHLKVVCFSRELNRYVTLEDMKEDRQVPPHFSFPQVTLQLEEKYSESEMLDVISMARRFGVERAWFAGAWLFL